MAYDNNEATALGAKLARSMGMKVKRYGFAEFRWHCNDRASAFHDKTSLGVWRTAERLAQAIVDGDIPEINKVLGSS